MDDGPMMREDAPEPDEDARQTIREEVARITATPEFTRAPVMRRLLEFLVSATLEGRGDQLKAYAIAVDGLGRPPDFDAQADSYPRVQVGRLRRMLDSFYAQSGAADGMRLSIPAGHYRVRFVPAAPPLVQPAPSAPPASVDAEREIARPRRWPMIAAVAGALLLLSGIGLWAFGALGLRARSPGLGSAPILTLSHLQGIRDVDALDLDVDAVLLDGIRRSWLVRVRTDDQQEPADRTAPPAYELAGDITGGANPVARLRLTRGKGGETLWTGQADLPHDPVALRAALAPLIADLIQPYGVIATDQRSRIGDDPAPGYPCILKFDQYRRDRNRALYAQARACVARTLALDSGDALALAAQSVLLIDEARLGFGPRQPGEMARSLALARRAVAADPYSAVAHMALARALERNGNCSAANRSGKRAIALDPNNPDLYALLGSQLLSCGDPDAEAMIRRAIALDPNPPPSVYAPLVFLALDRGDVAAARAAADEMQPPPNAARSFPDIILAVVAAAQGDRDGARRIWDRIQASNPDVARDPEAALRKWTVSERVRQKSLAYLRSAGLVPPVDAKAAPAHP